MNDLLREEYSNRHTYIKKLKGTWQTRGALQYKLEPDTITIIKPESKSERSFSPSFGEQQYIYFIKPGNVIKTWEEFIACIGTLYYDDCGIDERKIHDTVTGLEPYHVFYANPINTNHLLIVVIR